MQYTKRHAAWHDKPATDTPILAADLQAMDDALDQLLGKDTPAVDEVGVWTPASGGLVFQKIGANQIAAGAIDNSKVAAGAAIAYAKLALANSVKLDADVDTTTSLALARLAGYPSDATKYVRGDGTWAAVAGSPVGAVTYSAGLSIPSGWLLCDGSAVSRTTYAALFAALSLSKGAFTVTLASPGVFTLTGHGLVVGDSVYLTTTGALPTGLSQNTRYFVSVVTDANTFQLAATRGGTSINTSVSQSGTHTLVLAPYGVPDASNFNLPDIAGRVIAGRAVSGSADMKALGRDENVAVANRRMKHKHTPHRHTISVGNNGAGGGDGQIQPGAGNFATNISATSSTGSSMSQVDGGSGVSSDALDEPANIVLNPIIKT